MSEVQDNRLDLDAHSDADVLKELVHQGEVCLSDTVRLAIAADARATSLCGIFGTAGVALLALAAANSASARPAHAFIVAAIVAALLLLIASTVVAMAARPADFFAGGDEPRRLASVTDALSQLRYIASDFQMRIDANRATMKRSAARVNFALAIALLAIVGAAGAFIFS
jgi:hypothetical protein